MLGGLYDFIYNKVEEAGNAIQDVATSVTCPDVDKYIEKNKMSSDGKKKKSKKGKSKMMSDFEFDRIKAYMPFGPEHELFRKYLNGCFTTGVDSEKLDKRLKKAYSNGETVFDVVAREGYDVKVKKDGSLKIKKMKKEKPMLDSEGVSRLEDIEVAIIHKIEEFFVDIAQKCKSDDEIETVLTEMVDNNRLCVSIDLTDFLLDLIEPLKRLRKDLSSENETTEVKEL